MKGSERLPRKLRLRTRSEFLYVQNHGVKISGETFVALATRNSHGFTRLGITVSRKVGNAVHRNRMRRRMREAFRQMRNDFPTGLDVVLVARPSLRGQNFRALTAKFHEVSEKLHRIFP